MSPRRAPVDPDALARYSAEIAALTKHWKSKGESVRSLALRVGISHPTAGKILAGRDRSEWSKVALLIEELNGDVDEMYRLWRNCFEPSSGAHDAGISANVEKGSVESVMQAAALASSAIIRQAVDEARRLRSVADRELERAEMRSREILQAARAAANALIDEAKEAVDGTDVGTASGSEDIDSPNLAVASARGLVSNRSGSPTLLLAQEWDGAESTRDYAATGGGQSDPVPSASTSVWSDEEWRQGVAEELRELTDRQLVWLLVQDHDVALVEDRDFLENVLGLRAADHAVCAFAGSADIDSQVSREVLHSLITLRRVCSPAAPGDISPAHRRAILAQLEQNALSIEDLCRILVSRSLESGKSIDDLHLHRERTRVRVGVQDLLAKLISEDVRGRSSRTAGATTDQSEGRREKSGGGWSERVDVAREWVDPTVTRVRHQPRPLLPP